MIAFAAPIFQSNCACVFDFDKSVFYVNQQCVPGKYQNLPGQNVCIVRRLHFILTVLMCGCACYVFLSYKTIRIALPGRIKDRRAKVLAL
jgi:hypothetical protein